ncbi:NfeD family protein [Marisediminicola senii]|uniref:NfeD family protein n=1 Tax=Marisediminicola senii TaxID=2711233 RepID=UPI0013EA3739|nr:NfeD family protein [Marisediminicola senii]
MTFDLADYLWIVWLVFILVAVIIELLTLEFTFLMISVGSLGGLAANLLGADWWVQIVVAALLSVALLVTIRPLLLRLMRTGGDPTPSNVAALIGLSGRTVVPLGANGGLVRLANGETWTARIDGGSPTQSLDDGESVTVVSIEGSTAVVIPSERTTP